MSTTMIIFFIESSESFLPILDYYFIALSNSASSITISSAVGSLMAG